MSTTPPFSAPHRSLATYFKSRSALRLPRVLLISSLVLAGLASAQSPTATQVTATATATATAGEGTTAEEVTSVTGEPPDTSSDGDYAAVLRGLLPPASPQPAPSSVLQNPATVAYLQSLSSEEAERIFESTGLTDREADAVHYLAQQQGATESNIWSGTYEDNAVKNAFRSVTAPILAPSLMKTRRTAYTFLLENLLGNGNKEETREALRDMILRGEVALAQYSEQDQTYSLALPDNDIWKTGVRLCVACHQTKEKEAVVDHDSLRVIAPQAELLGTATDGRVMAWDAEQPLDGAVLDAYREVLTPPVTEALIAAFGQRATTLDPATSNDPATRQDH